MNKILNDKQKRILKIIYRILQPIITVVLALVIIFLVLGSVISINANYDRNEGIITRYINDGSYAEAYEMIGMMNSLYNTESEEYVQAEDFYSFYGYVVDYKIGYYTNNNDMCDTALREMESYMAASECEENKSHFEYIVDDIKNNLSL